MILVTRLLLLSTLVYLFWRPFPSDNPCSSKSIEGCFNRNALRIATSLNSLPLVRLCLIVTTREVVFVTQPIIMKLLNVLKICFRYGKTVFCCKCASPTKSLLSFPSWFSIRIQFIFINKQSIANSKKYVIYTKISFSKKSETSESQSDSSTFT